MPYPMSVLIHASLELRILCREWNVAYMGSLSISGIVEFFEAIDELIYRGRWQPEIGLSPRVISPRSCREGSGSS